MKSTTSRKAIGLILGAMFGSVFVACVGGGDGTGFPSSSSSGSTSSSSSSGTTSSSSSSSSSGGSGGPTSSGGTEPPACCEAICVSSATISFDVPDNASVSWSGATIKACRNAQCASGELAGASTTSLKNASGGGTASVTATTSLISGGRRVRVDWQLGTGLAGAAKGDVFTITAQSGLGSGGGDGGKDEIFSHTFEAQYEDTTICCSSCLTYQTGPK